MVGIKDFEMPNSCSECSFCGVYGQCLVSGTWVDEDNTDDNRDVDCPLVEVEDGNDSERF